MATGQVSPKVGKIVDTPDRTVTIGTATDSGTGSVASVAFTAGSETTGGPVFYYTATSTPGSFTGTASTSPVTVSGLTAGTAYTFKVKATNATGSGPESSASNSLTLVEPNSYEAIATLSGNGSSDTITFTSIPSTYKHLQIRGVNVVNYGSTDYGNGGLRFNSDTGGNYTNHSIRGYWDGSTGNKQGINYTLGTITYGMIFNCFLNQNQDSVFPTVIDILNYKDTNNRKVARAYGGSTYSTQGARAIIQGASMFWDSTSAITSISLFASNGNWNAKTKFTLYGIKDS